MFILILNTIIYVVRVRAAAIIAWYLSHYAGVHAPANNIITGKLVGKMKQIRYVIAYKVKDYSDRTNSFICRASKLRFYQYADTSRWTRASRITFLLHTCVKLGSRVRLSPEKRTEKRRRKGIPLPSFRLVPQRDVCVRAIHIPR